MGDVFANGQAISGKGTDNKSIAAFPSVCNSPPSPPAGPIPIPYPVTSMAGDTNDGAGSVVVNKKEAGKKNGSVYSKCNGNQPATRSFGMDLASATIEGKTKFDAYSSDVMIEKKGAERFLDLTSANHSNPSTAFTNSITNASGAKVKVTDCEKLDSMNEESRDEAQPSKRDKGTVEAAKYKPPGQKPVAYRARSSKSHVRPSLYEEKYAKGGWGQTKADKNNKLPSRLNKIKNCDAERLYGNNAQGAINHAEGKIVEELAGDILNGLVKPGGKITFNIDWAGKPKLPCPKCCDTLSEACACFDIELCDENGNSYDWCKDPWYYG